MRPLSAGVAAIIGIVTSVAAVALLLGVAILVALLQMDGSLVGSTGRVLLVWSVVCAVAAFAGGGWLAARLTGLDQEGRAAIFGALVGVGALLILVGSIEGVLGEQMDFHSVAVALGYVEVAPPAEELPFPITSPPASTRSTVDQHELARTRALTTIIYSAILAHALVVASSAGGWWAVTGRERRSRPTAESVLSVERSRATRGDESA